jgi:hypothetical protein
MTLTDISSLFQSIIETSKNKREKNKNFDGKQFWQPIKDILDKSQWKASKWEKQKMKKYNYVMELPEYYINGFGNQQIIEKNHFLIQIVRIPNKEEPSLKKIMQVALNIGQYIGYTGKNIKNISINNFISSDDSKIMLNNVLDKNSIAELNKLLL